jgi:hypothetical protein
MTNVVSQGPYADRLSCRWLSVRSPGVTATLIGYARCSTDDGIARLLGVSRSTLYRHVPEFGPAHCAELASRLG